MATINAVGPGGLSEFVSRPVVASGPCGSWPGGDVGTFTIRKTAAAMRADNEYVQDAPTSRPSLITLTAAK